MGKLEGLKSLYKSVLIYGVPGVGKTKSLGYLKGKTLILDIDVGTSVLAESDADIEVVRFNSDLLVSECYPANIFAKGTKFIEVINSLSQKNKYDNIALDSISELEKRMLTLYGKIDSGRGASKDGVPSQGDYQKVQFKLLDIVRLIRDIKSNLILTAWEGLNEYSSSDGSKYNQSVPLINNKVRDNICGLMDIIANLVISEKEESKGQRFFNLTLSNRAICRDRLNPNRAFCAIGELI